MSAEDNAPVVHPGPWLTIHALSEFVFCPRAGVLTFETRGEQPTEERSANLDFSLPYTLKELDKSLNRHLNRLWFWGAVAAAALGGAALAFWLGRDLWLVVPAVVLLLVARPLRRHINAVSALSRIRAVALSAQAAAGDIDFTDPSPQPVDWWELLAAGWISVPCHEPYRDEERALAGTPWRVLRRGSMTIPVFKMTGVAREEEPRLFAQHTVRMAGYCHLIETCEGRESPAGVVLFGNTYQGRTIPNSPQAKAALADALAAARAILDGNDEPLLDPPAAEICAGCPWGWPRRFRQFVTETEAAGELLPVFGTVAPDKLLYHSPCGDRFEWVAPHELALRLRLL